MIALTPAGYEIVTWAGTYVADSYIEAKGYIDAHSRYIPLNDNAQVSP